MNMPMLRHKFITGDPVQTKYLALLITSMFVPFLFLVGCINYMLYWISSTQDGMQAQATGDIFTVMMKLNYILLMGFPIFFLIIVAVGVALSHRLIGPLRRIKRDIDTISESGDSSKRIYVRKNDDIKPIVDSINKLLDNMAGKIK